MQTILGCNGIIGTELAKELKNYTNSVRLVSRTPKKVHDRNELFPADLLQAAQTESAVEGSDIVYLTAGLPYSSKVWMEQWPVIMQNVIAACKKHKAKLVFFDNVYMYGRVAGTMTEETPYATTSKKGRVRADIARMILKEIENGSLTAMICRAPEFYGPRQTVSGVNALVFDNIRKGKKAQWLVSDSAKRTFIFTPDASRATALLGNSPGTWNQTWHLPCDNRYPSGKEFMKMVSEAAGKEIKHTVLPKFFIRLGGLFVPYIREVIELLYQYDQDYIFSSDKFKTTFPEFKITPYEDGIREILEEKKP